MTKPVFSRKAALAKIKKKLGDLPRHRIRDDLVAGAATEADQIRYMDGDDKHLCELLDGVLIEKTYGLWDSALAAYFGALICNHVLKRKLGMVTGAGGPFRLRPGRVCMPDVLFIFWKRLPDRDISKEPILDAIPDIVVEVVNEENTSQEMETKLDEYFEVGVKLVWYAYRKAEIIEAYSSRHEKRTLGVSHTLDAGDVLPGFTMSVRQLFDRIKPPKKRTR